MRYLLSYLCYNGRGDAFTKQKITLFSQYVDEQKYILTFMVYLEHTRVEQK